MTWRINRPKWLCKKSGHIPWEENLPTHINGFFLCGCGKWFPGDDIHDQGSYELQSHPRFNVFKPISINLNFNSVKQIGQPPLTCDVLDNMTTTPFAYLRDNPDELDKMKPLEIRELIIRRLADYEEGMDAE